MDTNSLIIQELHNKWRLKLDTPRSFHDFIADWKMTDDCSLTKWAYNMPNLSINEVNKILLQYGEKNKQMLQAIHYHIGCLLPYEMRLEWTKIISKDSGVSCVMLQQDNTLTDEQIKMLDSSAKSAVNLYDTITNTNKHELYNKDSEIIQNILKKTQWHL